MKPTVSANASISAPLANASGHRPFFLGLVMALILGASGCRICADCEDMAYPAYGGSWQRTVRDSGRVASLFDPAGAKAGSMVGRDAPEEVDEQQRRRRVESGKDSDDDAEEDEDTNLDSDTAEEDDPSDMDDFKDLNDKDLEEMEDEKSNKLRDLELDDIEVQTLPSTNAPVAMR